MRKQTNTQIKTNKAKKKAQRQPEESQSDALEKKKK